MYIIQIGIAIFVQTFKIDFLLKLLKLLKSTYFLHKIINTKLNIKLNYNLVIIVTVIIKCRFYFI